MRYQKIKIGDYILKVEKELAQKIQEYFDGVITYIKLSEKNIDYSIHCFKDKYYSKMVRIVIYDIYKEQTSFINELVFYTKNFSSKVDHVVYSRGDFPLRYSSFMKTKSHFELVLDQWKKEVFEYESSY